MAKDARTAEEIEGSNLYTVYNSSETLSKKLFLKGDSSSAYWLLRLLFTNIYFESL